MTPIETILFIIIVVFTVVFVAYRIWMYFNPKNNNDEKKGPQKRKINLPIHKHFYLTFRKYWDGCLKKMKRGLINEQEATAIGLFVIVFIGAFIYFVIAIVVASLIAFIVGLLLGKIIGLVVFIALVVYVIRIFRGIFHEERREGRI